MTASCAWPGCTRVLLLTTSSGRLCPAHTAAWRRLPARERRRVLAGAE